MQKNINKEKLIMDIKQMYYLFEPRHQANKGNLELMTKLIMETICKKYNLHNETEVMICRQETKDQKNTNCLHIDYKIPIGLYSVTLSFKMVSIGDNQSLTVLEKVSCKKDNDLYILDIGMDMTQDILDDIDRRAKEIYHNTAFDAEDMETGAYSVITEIYGKYNIVEYYNLDDIKRQRATYRKALNMSTFTIKYPFRDGEILFIFEEVSGMGFYKNIIYLPNAHASVARDALLSYFHRHSLDDLISYYIAYTGDTYYRKEQLPDIYGEDLTRVMQKNFFQKNGYDLLEYCTYFEIKDKKLHFRETKDLLRDLAEKIDICTAVAYDHSALGKTILENALKEAY